MTTPQEPHELLGVSRDASEEEIRSTFRNRAKDVHPDLSDAPDAAERFEELRTAYEFLLAQSRRQRSGRLGSVVPSNSPAIHRTQPPPSAEEGEEPQGATGAYHPKWLLSPYHRQPGSTLRMVLGRGLLGDVHVPVPVLLAAWVPLVGLAVLFVASIVYQVFGFDPLGLDVMESNHNTSPPLSSPLSSEQHAIEQYVRKVSECNALLDSSAHRMTTLANKPRPWNQTEVQLVASDADGAVSCLKTADRLWGNLRVIYSDLSAYWSSEFQAVLTLKKEADVVASDFISNWQQARTILVNEGYLSP